MREQILNEYFKKYKDTKFRIKELNYKLEEYENTLYIVRRISYNSITKSTQPPKDILTRKIQIKDELVEEIDQLESDRKIMERKHINDIYRLKEDNHRRVMRMYYIDDLIIEKISNVMMLSENHVRKIKKRAEEEFISMIINDNK